MHFAVCGGKVDAACPGVSPYELTSCGLTKSKLGGQATNPIKEVGASILGVAAGLIDKVRAEEVSKDLRDDYTALGLANVSYVMLITTAIACNDRQTADLAAKNLKENAQFVMDIGSLIPYVVVRDLKDLTDLNENAVQEAREIYSSVWK